MDGTRFRVRLRPAARCPHFAHFHTGFNDTACTRHHLISPENTCIACVSDDSGTMTYMQRPRLVNRGSAVRVCYPAFVANSRGNTANQHPRTQRPETVVAHDLPTFARSVGENPCKTIDAAGHPETHLLAGAVTILVLLAARAGGVL